jgi:hypothetical protein
VLASQKGKSFSAFLLFLFFLPPAQPKRIINDFILEVDIRDVNDIDELLFTPWPGDEFTCLSIT